MIEPKKFEERWETFSSKYVNDFERFWKHKLEIENNDGNILDESHLDTTHHLLYEILRGWQAYRPFGLDRDMLKKALKSISEHYKVIFNYSLKNIDEVPRTHLKSIWVELGKVKSESKSDYQYVISVCKPLMLMWGQTLAFDSKVRKNIPHPVTAKSRWKFETWISILQDFSHKINQNPEIIDFFKEWSRKEFGTVDPVPYGRFLDIYFYSGP